MMANRSSASTNLSLEEPSLSIIPRFRTHNSDIKVIYTMHSSSSTLSLNEMTPTAAMNGISLYDDDQATPTPKERKALSESSLSTMTPPDSARGVSLHSEGSGNIALRPKESMFVKAQDDDDVFGRSSSKTPGQAPQTPSTSTTAITNTQAAMSAPVPFQQAPRVDRMSSPITASNAQGLLPPDACLFVANLATGRSDEELEIACHAHFDLFGCCYVKVRRDKHRHPFALVQYHEIEDADTAIRSSGDIVIDGRKIRVEHAQARRSVVLTRAGGGPVTEEEARQALENFGPIAQMYSTNSGEARGSGLPEGMWVQFAYYLDYKDAVKSFNSTTSDYRIHVPQENESRTHVTSTFTPTFKGFRMPRSNADQKSIFVGNLPHETSEHDLKRLFHGCGFIRAVDIIHKPIQGGSGLNTFGFIEFSSVGEAAAAAGLEFEIHGIKIRVEPKEYSARRHVRLGQYSPNMSPYHYGPRPNFQQIWSSPGGPASYRSNFYPMASPSHHATAYNSMQHVNEMSPFHHQGGFSNIYNTPPPSARMNRRNEMLYSGSPHHIAQWSPFVAGSGYPGGMMQIPEEMEGQRY